MVSRTDRGRKTKSAHICALSEQQQLLGRLARIDWRRLDLPVRLAPHLTLLVAAGAFGLLALLLAPLEAVFALFLAPAAALAMAGALGWRAVRRDVQCYIRALEGEGGLLWRCALLGLTLPRRLWPAQEACSRRAPVDPQIYTEALALFVRQAGLPAPRP